MLTKPDLIGQIVAARGGNAGWRRSATARDMDTEVPSTDNEHGAWRANCKACGIAGRCRLGIRQSSLILSVCIGAG